MARRRRRQRNPLLARIIFISIIVHVIALPILAHFGAFKKLQQQLMVSNVIVVPPPPPEEKKPEAKKAKTEHKQAAAGKKSISSASHAHPQPHQNLNMPKVLASATPSAGESGQPGV